MGQGWRGAGESGAVRLLDSINVVSLKLSTPIKFVKRVGDRVAEKLAEARGGNSGGPACITCPFGMKTG